MSFRFFILSSSFSLNSASRLHRNSLTLPSPPEDVTANPPPLEGCQSNFWETTCCCFVDGGILKQDKCGCTSGESTCESSVRLSYQPEPSRSVEWDSNIEPRWLSDSGFLKGFQAVEDAFCRAAPVRGPQIDSNERAFSCVCSTSLGHAEEFECGSSCSVEHCQRWKSNGRSKIWRPILEGRGKCCLNSITAVQEGCPVEIAPITENGAKSILADAIQQAQRSNQKNSFVILGSEHLVADMKESFETAKEKKMPTSRSGAQFFFSGDYGYILKSIHPPEYEVLHELAAPSDKLGVGLTSPLAAHKYSFTVEDDSIKSVENCVQMDIVAAQIDDQEKQLLISRIPPSFLNKWTYEQEKAREIGVPVYVNEINMVMWCKRSQSWITVGASTLSSSSMNPWKCEKKDDVFYQYLLFEARAGFIGLPAVEAVYRDIMLAFTEVKTSVLKPVGSGSVLCRCTGTRLPGTLINDFLVAFTYQSSSTWMVIRNSAVAVKEALKQHGFTKFHKDDDLFDVKPLPIHSDHRQLLFGMYFARQFMHSWRNWQSVRSNLEADVAFMNTALTNPMVDYSLLISAFYVDDTRDVLDYIKLPNCVERRLSELGFYYHSWEVEGSILICFTVIDMLMEFTTAKVPENVVLFQKWSNWGDKIMTMFDCLGQHTRRECGSYNTYLPRYRGVDVQLPSSFTQDVTGLLSGDGRVTVRSPALNNKPIEKKCCCYTDSSLFSRGRDRMGWCRLYAILDFNSSWMSFSNSTGCGYLGGSGYHSYWRYAKRCRVTRLDANYLRENAIMPLN